MRYQLKNKTSVSYGFRVEGELRSIRLEGGITGQDGRHQDVMRDGLSLDDLKLLVGHKGFCREVAAGNVIVDARALREAGYTGHIPASPFADGDDSRVRELEAEVLKLKATAPTPAPAVDISPLMAQLELMAQVNAALMERIEALEQKGSRKKAAPPADESAPASSSGEGQA